LETTLAYLTIAIVLATLLINTIATQIARARRDSVILRNIRAYATMPQYIGESLETDRPVHFSFGSLTPGGVTAPLTLANAETFTLLATRTTYGTNTPLLTTSEVATLPIGYDILRRAYRTQGRLNQFQIGAVQWYPDGARSLAFAAALTATMADRRTGSNILLGGFGSELALILDAATRRGQRAIAASDQLDGQAVAYAMSDELLIGEEMFVGGAYLGGRAAQTGAVVALDTLRVLLILTLGFLALDQLLQGALLTQLARVLNVGGGG
jgi:hypothetical protein